MSEGDSPTSLDGLSSAASSAEDFPMEISVVGVEARMENGVHGEGAKPDSGGSQKEPSGGVISSFLLSSAARPISNALGCSPANGMRSMPMAGSYGLAPTPPGQLSSSYGLAPTPPVQLSSSYGLAPTPPPLLPQQSMKCPLCLEPFREPKVLACFHSFCKPCLERQLESSEKIVCPACHMETQLSVQLGIDSLLNDFGLENVMKQQECNAKEYNAKEYIGNEEKGFLFGSPESTSSTPPLSDSPTDRGLPSLVPSSPPCTGCKSDERATNFCKDCRHYLCPNCTMAHQYMHCFEGHRVDQLTAAHLAQLNGFVAMQAALTNGLTHDKSTPVNGMSQRERLCLCLTHRTQQLRFFCLTCNLAICTECTLSDHVMPQHRYAEIHEVADQELAGVENLIEEARVKHKDLLGSFKQVDETTNRLTSSMARAHAVLGENVTNVIRILEDQRKMIAKELESVYNSKQFQLTMLDKRIQQMTEKLGQTIEFSSRLLKYSTPTEVLVFKQLLETRLKMFLAFNPDSGNILGSNCEKLFQLEIPQLNATAARQKLAGLLGEVKEPETNWSNGMSCMQPTPIARPPSRLMFPSLNTSPDLNDVLSSLQRDSMMDTLAFLSSSAPQRKQKQLSPPVDSLLVSSITTPFGSVDSSLGNNFLYDKWSCALEPHHGEANGGVPTNLSAMHQQQQQQAASAVPSNDVEGMKGDLSMCFPPKSQIKRQKMIYHCKFGEFGVLEGQFTEPSGVAVNAQNDIVVADTNNHRIQVFDREGRFKFQFGECGKRDGQLLYPNRVAVNKLTGDFVVTERSPTHQIQVYNHYGQFMRKFGANILQHPRGVCVDTKGRIIVVECKVMRVIIFDMFGNILQKFSCSRYLEFPNGVCANEKNEILISDNRAHCIKVFSYEGQFLRQIGGEGITNYPIGVGINSLDQVVVADNHNNFNLTVFDQNGQMIGALESKVKHAQCFDVALVDNGSVVLASKDYRLYLYRFLPSAASSNDGQ